MLDYNDFGAYEDKELRLIVSRENFEGMFGKNYSYDVIYKKATQEWKNVLDSWKRRAIIS